ncbi:MAG: hypothetical protein HY560_09885 [Gemmatimonadetes bacterium]|nr:hypothetical protein [Gemmatimonadota bacterium]
MTTDALAPYTAEEAAKIRDCLRAPSGPVLCPRCGTPLGFGDFVAGGGTTGFYWLYRCVPCRRGVTLTDIKS